MERLLSVSILLFAGLSSFGAEASEVAVRTNSSEEAPNLQTEVCQFCFRECPVSCFAGQCGLNLGTGISRYQGGSHCWTCDPAFSTMYGGSMQFCTPQQSGATQGMTRVNADGTIPATSAAAPPPMGGDILGAQFGKTASEKIAAAVTSLEAAAGAAGIAGGNPSGLDGALAAHAANSTAQAAGANMTETGAHGLSAEPAPPPADPIVEANPMMDAAVADNHRMAMQIRAAEALRTSQMAHAAWQMALNTYNWHLSQLRAQQITLDQSEEVVERMEKAANAARSAWTDASTQVAVAAQAAVLSGDGAAGAEVAAAARVERETTYRSAQRRLLIAASEAKKASDLASTIQNKGAPVAGGMWVEVKTKDSYPGCAMPMKAPDPTHCKAKALELGFAGFSWYTGQCCQGTCCFKDNTPAELLAGVVSDCGKTLWLFNPTGLLTNEQQAAVAPAADCPRCDWASGNTMINMDCATVTFDEASIDIGKAKVMCEEDVNCLGLVWHNKEAENINFVSTGHFQGCGGAIGANPKPGWDIVTKPGTCQTSGAAASASLLNLRANVTLRGPLRGLPAALAAPEVQAVQPEALPYAQEPEQAVINTTVVADMGPGSFTAAAEQAQAAEQALPMDPNAAPEMMALPADAGADPSLPAPPMPPQDPSLAAMPPAMPDMPTMPGADASAGMLAMPAMPAMPAGMPAMPAGMSAEQAMPAGMPAMPEGMPAMMPPMPMGMSQMQAPMPPGMPEMPAMPEALPPMPEALLETRGRTARFRREQPPRATLRLA